jgi:hypothetical protein
MRSHVRRVATLLIVEGVLEIVPGALISILGLAAALGMATDASKPGLDMIPPELAFVVWILGPALLAAGALKVVAGTRNLKVRGRTLGLVALASGVVALPTCYCAPTALGLFVYGLVVYLDADVRRAFAESEREPA